MSYHIHIAVFPPHFRISLDQFVRVGIIGVGVCGLKESKRGWGGGLQHDCVRREGQVTRMTLKRERSETVVDE